MDGWSPSGSGIVRDEIFEFGAEFIVDSAALRARVRPRDYAVGRVNNGGEVRVEFGGVGAVEREAADRFKPGRAQR